MLRYKREGRKEQLLLVVERKGNGMIDNLYVVQFLMKQKQEQIENKARHSWMLEAGTGLRKQPKEVTVQNSQPACCPAV